MKTQPSPTADSRVKITPNKTRAIESTKTGPPQQRLEKNVINCIIVSFSTLSATHSLN